MADEGVAPWMPANNEDSVQIGILGMVTNNRAGTGLCYEKFDDQDLEELRKGWTETRTNPENNFPYQNNWLNQNVKNVIKGKVLTKADISQVSNFLMGDKNESGDNGIDDCIRWHLINFAIEDEETLRIKGLKQLDVETTERPTTLDPRRLLLGILLQKAPHISFLSSSAEKLKKTCVNLSSHHPESAMSSNNLSKRRRWLGQEDPQSNHSSKDLKSHFHAASNLGLTLIVKAMIQLGFYAFKKEKTESRVIPNPSGVTSSESIGKSKDPKQDFARILGAKDGDGKTALFYASEQLNLPVVDALLEFHYSVAYPPDQSFADAVKFGKENVVKRFLLFEELHEYLISEGIIILSIEVAHAAAKLLRSNEEEKEFYEECINVAKKLLKLARDKDLSENKDLSADKKIHFNSTVADKIIEFNLTELWDLVPNSLSRTSLLHTAVLYQMEWFVDTIATNQPASVTERLSEKYALWYNNYLAENKPRSKKSRKIRTTLVDTIIRRTRKMEVLADILHQSGESGKLCNHSMQAPFEADEMSVLELCFDLSRFNSKSYRLYDFAESLINHRENTQLLSYEPLIKYAEFPALDLHPDDKERFHDEMSREHEEIFVILNWLKKHKEVTTILELQVRDRLFNPHDEHRIAECVEEFKVEILNWRFLDLSISVFEKSKSRLTGLHLYASGKQAPISHWFSEEGIISLPYLEKISIHIVQDMIRADRCKELQRNLKNRLRKLKNSKVLKYLQTTEVDVQPWNPKSLERIRDLDEIGKKAVPNLFKLIDGYRNHVESNQRDIERLRKEIMEIQKAESESQQELRIDSAVPRSTNANGIEDVSKPIEKLKELESRPFVPTKIAILDNGILSIAPAQQSKSGEANGLWSRIKEGRSFVDDADRSSPWLFASDPHGTQMANLICAIDPMCDLYVAKVTEGKFGISPGRVAKAIDWARSKRVDIISMSFAILEPHPILYTAVERASNEGIVMLCSTHDEGLNTHKAYPANYGKSLCITACDEYGTLPQNPPVEYDYRLHGTNISAGVIPFLVSDDRISGSSVATAIAAGLSSLIISCDRLVFPGKQYGPETTTRMDLVKSHFDTMVSKNTNSKENEKYVILEKFAGFSNKSKDGEHVEVLSIITEAFKDKQGQRNI